MSYNPPRAGQINAGPRRNPYASGGGVVGGRGNISVNNSEFKDRRNPQAVYDRSITEGKQRYEQSALKNFFDFALSDEVKGTYESILENNAKKKLGDLIANSPDIVEGWKKGSAAERAYVSNLNPFAQNLIEETLSEQVANEYVQSVNAGLASSSILTSPSSTEEQLAAERSRIMADASEKTGYGALNPYWVSQTVSDVSRIQSATEGKIDAQRQQNIAAENLTKYGNSIASYWVEQSGRLNMLKPSMDEQGLSQAYVEMNIKIEQDARRALDATVATPSTYLSTLLDGLETQASKLIAAGDEDAALSLLENMQKAVASRDIVFENGVNLFEQRDANGNSGIELLNGIQQRVQREVESGEQTDATKWAESMVDRLTPQELIEQGRKRFPGQQAAILGVMRGDVAVDNFTSPEQDRIGLEFISRGGTPEEGVRLIEENLIPWSSDLASRIMGSARNDDQTADIELQTTFRSALDGERVSNQINQLAYELTDPKMAEKPAVKAVKRGLRIPEGEMDMDTIVQALERAVRIDSFTALQEQDAQGKFDEESSPSKLVAAQELLLKEIETLREQANFKPLPKEKSDKDPNIQYKQWLKNYAQRKQDGEVGLALFDQNFIDMALKGGVINDGMNATTKERKLAEMLANRSAELTLDGKSVYTNKEQVQKIMRGELDPFTLQDPALGATAPSAAEPKRFSGSRRRFYKRPEPSPADEPNPFAEPPQMIDMPPLENEEQEVSSAVETFKQGLYQIASVALDVLTGGSPAAAQVDFEDNTGEMARLWTRKKQLSVNTPPLPQINGNVVVKTVPIAMTTPRHPYFVAIGIAEGTRTPDGGFTKAWFGHGDPADGNYNRGTVSGGRGPTRGMSPEQVDNYYLKELTGLALAVAPVLQQYGMKPNAQIWHRTIFNYLDLHVQSPAAARDFLKKIPEAIKAGGQIEAFAKIRADSYRDPVSGRLYTSFASYADLFRDQRSRAGAYDYRKRL